MSLINIAKTLPRDFRILRLHLKILKGLKDFEKSRLSVSEVFDKVALKNLNKPAFLYKDEVWTFKQVYEKSNQIGNLLSAAGIQRGDRVSIFMENKPDYVCAWMALTKLGASGALINFNLLSSPLKHSFDVAGAKAIVCGYELAENFKDAYNGTLPNVPIFATGSGDRNILPGSIDLDKELLSQSPLPPTKKAQDEDKGKSRNPYLDPLFFLYTSGTTGLPKAAVMKQARFFLCALACYEVSRLTQDDIFYETLPLYHTSGIIGAANAVINGLTVVLRDKFSASNFWSDCIKYDVTIAQYIGEIMRYLVRQDPTPEERNHKVRILIGNGLRPEIWEEVQKRFGVERINEVYGATEGNVSMSNCENKVGSCGFVPLWLKKVFPYGIVRLGPDGEPVRDPKTGLLIECKAGEVGELVGKITANHPFQDFKGYPADKKATTKKILHDAFVKGDSVFRSGDLFMQDELGFMYFKDRMGDTFRWKGENVATSEVEYVITNLTPKKLDVVVFPVKIPGTEGQAGMGVIADEDSILNLTDLSLKMRKALASYAIPIFLRVVKEIEKTGTHRLKKGELQKEGYDVSKVQGDKLYFWSTEESGSGRYVPLTKELHDRIINGSVKL